MTEDQHVGGIFEVGAVARYFDSNRSSVVSVQNRFDALEDDDAAEDVSETCSSRGNETFPSLGAPATAKKMFDGVELFEKRLEAAHGSPTAQP